MLGVPKSQHKIVTQNHLPMQAKSTRSLSRTTRQGKYSVMLHCTRRALLIGGFACAASAATATYYRFEDFNAWTQSGTTLRSPKMQIVDDWTELVPSWGVDLPAGASIQVSARISFPDAASRWYSFGKWTTGGKEQASAEGHKDALGTLYTDTLVMNRPGGEVEFQIDLNEGSFGRPRLTDFAFCATGPLQPDADESNRKMWGQRLPVFKRNQGDYPGGGVLCSPTSVSMLLRYWSDTLDRPILDRDVPLVQAGVYDNVYRGTGNWSFNMAFANSMPGLVGTVDRFNSIVELEKWLEFGVPVACSVSYDLLQGKGKKGANDGHLVVLIGFDANGDPIFNDPGRRDPPQRTFKRADFKAAWETSQRAVYLVYPKTWTIPREAQKPIFRQ